MNGIRGKETCVDKEYYGLWDWNGVGYTEVHMMVGACLALEAILHTRIELHIWTGVW